MAGILSIANSSLSAFQRALAVTGNNIANAKTPGYTRQVAQFNPLPYQKLGGSYIGSGTQVDSIKRYSDYFANQQVRSTTTTKTNYDVYYEQASQIDKLLSSDGTSISTSLQNFFNALGQLNDAPDNLASRNVALKESQMLVNQFTNMESQLSEYQRSSSSQLQEAIKNINNLSARIAEINGEILENPNSPGLLDQRDNLLLELAEYVEIDTSDNTDGTVNVFVGTGQSLVIGNDYSFWVATPSVSTMTGTKISIANGAGEIDITNNLKSGRIGALLSYEDEVIKPASQMIGQMAIGLAQTFNSQHKLGMDLNNLLGKDFFTDFNSSALQLERSAADPNNTGTAVFSVSIDDISQTKISDYDIYVTNAATNEIRVIRKSDGQSTVMNFTSTPPAPPAGQVQIDGMTITADDLTNLATNDKYTVSPTRGAARHFDVLISDPRELAMASPVHTEASLSNTGTGAIKMGDVLNTAVVNKEFRIEFISPTQYNLVNVTDTITTGPFAFTPNADNTIDIPDSITPSYSVVVSGIPKTGDQFTASYNTGGFGDNANGLKLNGIQKAGVFSNNSENIFERYSGLIADVGSKTYQAKIRSEAADVLYQQAVDFRESKSGVNLDEEAANLLRFQQSYQAAGKLMEVAQNMIDSLFAVMR